MSRRSLIALSIAVGAAAAAVVVWAVALHTVHGRSADLRWFDRINEGLWLRQRLWVGAGHLAVLCNPAPYALLCMAVIALALFVRGPRASAVVAGALVTANLTTEVLKISLAANRVGSTSITHIDTASWPSGHATAAASLALCAVFAVPTLVRPVVALIGLAFTGAMGIAVTGLAWHYPSDVVGGYCVALAVCAAALPLLNGRELSRPAATAVLRSRSPHATE